jgi:transcriptional regulator with XRE-family HTH domain
MRSSGCEATPDLSIAALAHEAGLDPGYVWRIEHAEREPTIGVLAAISDALGADLSIRLYPNTGPRIRDRHQSAIADALLGLIAPRRWTMTPEVGVRKPVRGSIDLVAHDRAARVLVAIEVESLVRRLEQLLRWHQDKADALPSSDLWAFASADGDVTISRLLVMRSTETNRHLARHYEALLRAAYPARTIDARAAMTTVAAWPGPSVLWADVRNGKATIL